MDTFDAIRSFRLLPVAIVESVDEGLRMAEALLKGGLPLIEVTLRTAAAEEAIRAIIREFPNMLVGAGTILDPERVPALAEAGVRFGVAPGLNAKVVEACQKAGLPLTPGVVTPSEVEQARTLGCKVLKFFPAEAAGGVKMLSALTGPYGHTGIQFIPTGGIDVEKAKAYWALPSVAAVGGSWFVAPKLVKAGQFDTISSLTAEALKTIKDSSL